MPNAPGKSGHGAWFCSCRFPPSTNSSVKLHAFELKTKPHFPPLNSLDVITIAIKFRVQTAGGLIDNITQYT